MSLVPNPVNFLIESTLQSNEWSHRFFWLCSGGIYFEGIVGATQRVQAALFFCVRSAVRLAALHRFAFGFTYAAPKGSVVLVHVQKWSLCYRIKCRLTAPYLDDSFDTMYKHKQLHHCRIRLNACKQKMGWFNSVQMCVTNLSYLQDQHAFEAFVSSHPEAYGSFCAFLKFAVQPASVAIKERLARRKR